MPRKNASSAGAKKKTAAAPKAHKLPEEFPAGMCLTDQQKHEWQLGSVLGQGGFGLIYLAADKSNSTRAENYVIKIEPKGNGPLYCEIQFYMRVAKQDSINKFTSTHRLHYLAVPPFVGWGLVEYKSKEYRFLVMPRMGTDLQKKLMQAGGQFDLASTCAVGLRMVDALQFMHESEYVHADIKAANILLGFKGGQDVTKEVYLVDYGLASRYTVGDDHKEYKEDLKRAHDGTIEFTSRDAHKGLAPSRRGDLEILGYCLLQWLVGSGHLPWEHCLNNPNLVADGKERFMSNVRTELAKCLKQNKAASDCMSAYFQEVNKLEYQDAPNYQKFRAILKKSLHEAGQKDEWSISFTAKGKKRKMSGAGSSSVSPKKSPRSGTPQRRKSPASSGRQTPIHSLSSPAATTKRNGIGSSASSLSLASLSTSGSDVHMKSISSASISSNGRQGPSHVGRSPLYKTKSPAATKKPSRSPAVTKSNSSTTSASSRSQSLSTSSSSKTAGKPSKRFPMPPPTKMVNSTGHDRNKRMIRRVPSVQSDMSIQTSPGLFGHQL